MFSCEFASITRPTGGSFPALVARDWFVEETINTGDPVTDGEIRIAFEVTPGLQALPVFVQATPGIGGVFQLAGSLIADASPIGIKDVVYDDTGFVFFTLIIPGLMTLPEYWDDDQTLTIQPIDIWDQARIITIAGEVPGPATHLFLSANPEPPPEEE